MFRTVAAFIVVALVLAACGSDRNQPPTVEASASASEVAVGEEVTVDGSQSADPDGDPLLFRWMIDAPEQSAVAIDDLRTDTITFAPDVAGTYNVYLTVDDGEFESARANVTIEASGTGAPIVDAGPDQSVDIGAEVTLDGTNSSDPNGDDLTYQWTFDQKPQGSTAEFSDATIAQPSFVADVAGDFIISLVVSDGELTSDSDTVIVSVGGEGNQPPVADAGDDQAADVGTEVTLDGSGSSDSDSPQLTYFWQVVSEPQDSSVSIVDATKQVARFTPTHAGTYEFELTVSDGDTSDADTVSVVTETSVSPTCLLISEYIEGSSGDNKAIELYNCDSASIDLSGFGFCIATNANSSCTNYDIALSGTLAQGEVLTLCNNSLDTSLLNDPGDCDVSEYSVNFNGNDRIVVYEDVDNSEDFSPDDVPTDVFGEISNPPSETAWSDVTLRRCNFGRFDGQSAFDYSAYFLEADADDFSDFGVAPVEGCP